MEISENRGVYFITVLKDQKIQILVPNKELNVSEILIVDFYLNIES